MIISKVNLKTKITSKNFHKPLDNGDFICYDICVIFDIVHLLQKGAAMFSIDLTSRTPIYEQIYNKIIELIISGTLVENSQLPSVRSLAKNAGVNPNTVAKAYQELERNGIIYSLQGRGSFIAKPDSKIFQSSVLEAFDNSVNEAFKRGVSPEQLKSRIDRLKEKCP